MLLLCSQIVLKYNTLIKHWRIDWTRS